MNFKNSFPILGLFFGVLFVLFSPGLSNGQSSETPFADFTAAPLVGKAPLTVTFTDDSTASAGQTITGWTWTFGDGGISSEQNPSHVFGMGAYTISLTVSDSGGGSDTKTKINYIIVNEDDAQFTVGSVSPIAAQEGVAPDPKFHAEVVVGGATPVNSCALYVDGVSQGGMVNKATGRSFTLDACAPGNSCVAEHPTYSFPAGSAGAHSVFARCVSDRTADGIPVSVTVSRADGGGKDDGGDGGAVAEKKCDEDEVKGGVIRFRNPLCVDSFEDLLDTLLNFLFWIATALAPILALVGAFYFLTAAGSPDKIKKARDILLWTVIGYGIIVLSKGIIAVFKEIFGISG